MPEETTIRHTLGTEGLTRSYGKRTVVKNVGITVKTGEIVGLLGPNGAGKTTTFYMIVGMIPPDGGAIAFDMENITAMPMYLRARKGIGYLPQEASIFRKLSVRDNLRAVLEIKGTWSNGKRDRDALDAEIAGLVEEFNLTDFADREGYRLSGGERRRAEIARAIALKPLFLLFDEPFTGVDPLAIVDLKKMLRYLKEKGIGILITDHNVRDTLSITDRAYIISEGSVLAAGEPDELIGNRDVKKAYLGEEFSREWLSKRDLN